MRTEGSPPPIVRLNRPLTIVGSKSHAHLRIVATEISGSHALLLNRGNNVFVRDLMSRTHVFVNEKPVSECRLRYGDIVRFGPMSFRYQDEGVLRNSAENTGAPPAQVWVKGIVNAAAIDRPLFVIGRQRGADLVLRDPSVSKAHAVIFQHDGHHVLRDLGTRSGTMLNGTAVRAATLRGGDVIEIGGSVIRFEIDSPQPAAAVEAPVDGDVETDATGESHVFVAEPEVFEESGRLQPTLPAVFEPIPASGEDDFTTILRNPEIEPPPAAERHANSIAGSTPAGPHESGEGVAELFDFDVSRDTLTPELSQDRVVDSLQLDPATRGAQTIDQLLSPDSGRNEPDSETFAERTDTQNPPDLGGDSLGELIGDGVLTLIGPSSPDAASNASGSGRGDRRVALLAWITVAFAVLAAVALVAWRQWHSL